MKAILKCQTCNRVYGESLEDNYSEIIPGHQPISHGLCDNPKCKETLFEGLGIGALWRSLPKDAPAGLAMN